MSTTARIVWALALVVVGDHARLLAQDAVPPTGKNVPSIADDEIARRGNLVEVVGTNRADITTALAEAMRPPADDSHKWFISVITTQSCPACARLQQDIATSPHLKPFVNTQDEQASWAHYNVFRIEDPTQKFRWREIRFAGFPTIVVQPPRNGTYGDHKTVVLQSTGYDGDAKALAQKIRVGIAQYVAKLNVNRQRFVRSPRGHGQATPTGQDAGDYTPPFTPPPKYEPPLYPQPTPSPFPFDFPPQTVPQPAPNLGSLLFSLLGGLFSSGGLTNLLLLVLAGLAVIRTFRKATGQKLLLDDETFQAITEMLKSLVNPNAPKSNG